MSAKWDQFKKKVDEVIEPYLHEQGYEKTWVEHDKSSVMYRKNDLVLTIDVIEWRMGEPLLGTREKVNWIRVYLGSVSLQRSQDFIPIRDNPDLEGWVYQDEEMLDAIFADILTQLTKELS
jgi:hypothetical protein